jgi:hypothetical protein
MELKLTEAASLLKVSCRQTNDRGRDTRRKMAPA